MGMMCAKVIAYSIVQREVYVTLQSTPISREAPRSPNMQCWVLFLQCHCGCSQLTLASERSASGSCVSRHELPLVAQKGNEMKWKEEKPVLLLLSDVP